MSKEVPWVTTTAQMLECADRGNLVLSPTCSPNSYVAFRREGTLYALIHQPARGQGRKFMCGTRIGVAHLFEALTDLGIRFIEVPGDALYEGELSPEDRLADWLSQEMAKPPAE